MKSVGPRVLRQLFCLCTSVFFIFLLIGCSPKVEAPPPEERIPTLLQRLAENLNPDYPGLKNFFEAWQEGDTDLAREELLKYFRDKPVPQEALPPEIDRGHPTLAAAVDGLRGIFFLQGSKGSTRQADGTINWNYRGPNNDREWGWMLHRHPFFRQFLVAYEERGDPAFVEAIDSLLLEWYWLHPPPDGFRLSAAWRALEAARRLVDNWLPVYDALRGHPSLSDEAVLAIILSASEHARYLQANHHYGGNHLITEMMALATIAVVWPEFQESPEWLDYAAKRAVEEIQNQTYPDGAHKELANHYQWIASSSFQRLYQILLVAEFGDDEAISTIRERLEKMWDYYAGVTRPNGYGPLNNDSDLELNAEQLLAIAEYYGRQDWLHIATQGQRGQRPEGHPSRYYPWAGHVVMRNGWDRHADWIFFDRGYFGTDHQQDDRLHLSVSLNGNDILVDSGRYVYRDDLWSRFFRSAEAHNVPTLQNQQRVLPDREARTPTEGLLAMGDGLQLSSGQVPFSRGKWGGWGATHRRAVVMGEGWVWIVDRIDSAKPDLATYRWRFHPDIKPNIKNESGIFTLVDTEGHAQAYWIEGITESSSFGHWVHGQREPYVQGWYSPSYNIRIENWVREINVPVVGSLHNSWLLINPHTFVDDPLPLLKNDSKGSTMALPDEEGEKQWLRLSFKEEPEEEPLLSTGEAFLYRKN